MIVLGLDTSCDDTSAAIVSNGRVLSEVISTQIEHREWGGVVPEIASRAHLRNILPVIDQTLQIAGMKKGDIQALGVTCGPGLIGALLVGVNFAKGWCDALNLPLIPINHLQAHIWAVEIDGTPILPPFIALIVSGGHTLLAKVHSYSRYQILGETLDDSAGEVLDKIGRLMGLKYPCGAEIEARAKNAIPDRVKLPRGMLESKDLNFSFSGLKTAARLFLDKNPQYYDNDCSPDFFASLQDAIFEVLVQKTVKALQREKINHLVLGGGVAANSRLRQLFQQEQDIELHFPPPKWCTDNGAMVAYLAEKIFTQTGYRPGICYAQPDLSLDAAP
jgi:N6-L-threonylcarbamoyladenine synthase